MIVKNSLTEQHQLESRITEALNVRLNPEYTESEIEKVSSLDKSLFPKDFHLDFETSEHFRRLAIYSQVELKPLSSISSHRKFIGRFIVAAKKITWPFISAHLKPTFVGLQEMNANLVYMQAKHEVSLRKLSAETKVNN